MDFLRFSCPPDAAVGVVPFLSEQIGAAGAVVDLRNTRTVVVVVVEGKGVGSCVGERVGSRRLDSIAYD